MIVVCIILTILVLFFLLILFSFVEVHIHDFNFSTEKINERFVDNNFKVSIKLKFLGRLTIFKFDIDKKKLEKENVRTSIKKIQSKLNQDKDKFSIENITLLKNFKINLKMLSLQVLIGIEDASINAIFVGLASAFISIVLGLISQNTKNCDWKVIPLYQNTNLLKINFDCIFSLKLMHIIYTIYILIKKGEKYGRTSNRRAYVCSNE